MSPTVDASEVEQQRKLGCSDIGLQMTRRYQRAEVKVVEPAVLLDRCHRQVVAVFLESWSWILSDVSDATAESDGVPVV